MLEMFNSFGILLSYDIMSGIDCYLWDRFIILKMLNYCWQYNSYVSGIECYVRDRLLSLESIDRFENI